MSGQSDRIFQFSLSVLLNFDIIFGTIMMKMIYESDKKLIKVRLDDMVAWENNRILQPIDQTAGNQRFTTINRLIITNS